MIHNIDPVDQEPNHFVISCTDSFMMHSFLLPSQKLGFFLV